MHPEISLDGGAIRTHASEEARNHNGVCVIFLCMLLKD